METPWTYISATASFSALSDLQLLPKLSVLGDERFSVRILCQVPLLPLAEQRDAKPVILRRLLQGDALLGDQANGLLLDSRLTCRLLCLVMGDS